MAFRGSDTQPIASATQLSTMRAMKTNLGLSSLGVALLLWACGSPEQGQGAPSATVNGPVVSLLPGSGTVQMSSAPMLRMLDSPVTSAAYEDIQVVEVTIDGKTKARLGVDTGAPVVVVNPALVGQMGTTAVTADLQLGSRTFKQIQIVAEGILSGSPLDGLLGCTVICQQEISFNYRDHQFTLGDATAPPNVEDPAHVIPFKLAGGLSLLGLPASRVLVSAEIEGEAHTFMIDSGAFAVGLRGELYKKLIADDRATFDIPVTTATGQSASHLTRLKTVSVGGVAVEGPVATSGDALDKLFGNVSFEVGEQIDGVIGATYLHDFFVSVDYPNSQLLLRRYATEDHVHDLAIRVGFFASAGQNGAAAAVASVVPSTDADRKGVKAGDPITVIDGTTLTADNAGQLLATLAGKAGDTHTITFGDRGAKTIAVEDLLPFTQRK